MPRVALPRISSAYWNASTGPGAIPEENYRMKTVIFTARRCPRLNHG